MFLKDLWELFQPTYDLITQTSVFWLPILLVSQAVELWRRYTRSQFLSEQEWVLLEIKVPKLIAKSPLAMELFLDGLHLTSQGTWFDRFWGGKVKPSFVLELTSINGRVHFFIRTQTFHRELVEHRLYSQYPEVEIHEVSDYVLDVPYGHEGEDWDVFGFEFKFTNKNDAYPIKTYIDYGMDKALSDDEEQKIDPLTPIIELLGSLKGTEQIWIQIPIRASEKRFKVGGSLFEKQDWKAKGSKLVEEIYKKNSKVPIDDDSDYSNTILSPGERRVVEAVERNLSKRGFDCGIRCLYVAREDDFNPISFVALIGSFKQFNDEDMNGFKPDFSHGTSFDYPWQDLKGIRMRERKRRVFSAYSKRSFFYPPHKRIPLTLSSEELATIYHFPGGVSETPTFQRVESKTTEPPVDLPI